MNKVMEHLVYLDTLEMFSERHQFLILMEECAELQQELSKFLRGKPKLDALAEELADVEIVLAQVKMILENNTPGLFDYWKNIKLERLELRLRNGGEALK